jgi:hypothetical protein
MITDHCKLYNHKYNQLIKICLNNIYEASILYCQLNEILHGSPGNKIYSEASTRRYKQTFNLYITQPHDSLLARNWLEILSKSFSLDTQSFTIGCSGCESYNCEIYLLARSVLPLYFRAVT